MNRLAGPLSAASRRIRGRHLAAPEAVVLGYHDVTTAGAEQSPLCVSEDALRTHIRCLRSFGFELVAASVIAKRLRAEQSVAGLAAITFDDALVGVFRRGLRVLREEEAPATVFVVTDELGANPHWWGDVSRTVTSEELAELAAGPIELGSHTRSHRSLPELDHRELHDELAGSRDDLASALGVAPTLLAYPSGHHDGRVRQATRTAGYDAAFTFLNGRVDRHVDPLRIPRLTMGTHMSTQRLTYHLRRSAASWGDHQVDEVGAVALVR